MRSSNPVFSNNPAFTRSGGGYATFGEAPSAAQLEEMYGRPPATPLQTQRITFDDVVVKTAILFAVLLASAAASWVLTVAMPFLPFAGMIVGLVLGLVVSFKSSTNPALILPYAAAEGVFVGGISRFFANRYDDIVGQAVLGTLAAFAAMLFLYRSGRLRATPKFTKVLVTASLGYLIIGLVSLVAGIMGVGGGWGFYGSGPLGILLCLAGVGLASLFLILDFDFVEQAIRNGAPQRTSWLAAFGLVATLVWLYIEILRLLAILRSQE